MPNKLITTLVSMKNAIFFAKKQESNPYGFDMALTYSVCMYVCIHKPIKSIITKLYQCRGNYNLFLDVKGIFELIF
jgi:hypothetical protein